MFDSIENRTILIDSMHSSAEPSPLTHLITHYKQAIANTLKRSRFRDERLIVVLLIIALSSVFIFGSHRVHFHGYHDWESGSNLTLATNLSQEHNFLLFHRQTLDEEGRRIYEPYNRQPIGGYVLIKLAILPFMGDFSNQIYAGRILTLVLFSAAAILAYLAISRITNNRWSALGATLLAFSSYYMLYHNDMIGESVGSLFGVMLVFHGMAVFIQENRFRQLLIKTCIALLLGWHVYALLLVFILFGMASELIGNRSKTLASLSRISQLKARCIILIRSRYLVLGIVALLFGASLLVFNFTNEYLGLNRETPLTELPSFRSMLRRIGVEPTPAGNEYQSVVWKYLYRIGGMSIPYYLPGYDNAITLGPRASLRLHGVIIGSIVLAASLASIFLTRHKMLIATLVLSNILWAIVMRHTVVYHNHEAIFSVGIPIAMFSIYFNRLSSRHLVVGVAVAAIAIFTLSVYQINASEYDKGYEEGFATLQTEVQEDFQAIREIGTDNKILVYSPIVAKQSEHFARQFYLAGNIILFEYQEKQHEFADFVITTDNDTKLGLLTPENKHWFLYDKQLYDQRYQVIYDMVQSNEPVIRSEFDVYLNQNALLYIREYCRAEDTQAKFLLHVTPIDINDLPEDRRQHGFDNLDFQFDDKSGTLGEKCVAQIQLPEYEIASIRTGQYISGGGELWSNSYSMPQQ